MNNLNEAQIALPDSGRSFSPASLISKLPNTQPSIFSAMTALAQQHQAINLAQGFPNFSPPQRLIELVAMYMQKGYLYHQYSPVQGIMPLREQLAKKLALLYQVQVNPMTDITITAGGSEALYSALTAHVHHGDEVIIIEPAFDCYRPIVTMNGGIPIVYELQQPDFRINWQQLGQLISPRTRVIMVNTPHNPTATIFDANDWAALAKLVEGTNIIVLSDEVYEHLVFDGQPHLSLLSYPALFQRGIAVFSFGKTYHGTGWRMGYAVAPNYLSHDIQKVHQYNLFAVPTFLQYAIADFLDDQAAYLSLAAFYQEKRDFFSAALSNSRFQLLPSQGSYFQLANYSNISQLPDMDFVKRLTIDHGVAAIPVSVFYSNPQPSHLIRFCFAKTNDLLEQAAEKLCKI